MKLTISRLSQVFLNHGPRIPALLSTLIFLGVSLSIRVSAGISQTITFPAIPARQPTDGPFSLNATATSGLPVSYQLVGGAGVASISGSIVTLGGSLGAFTIAASQSGNSTYNAAASVLQSSVVASAAYSQVACGSGSSVLAIRSDGVLWAWGSNWSGQLGDGSTVSRIVPEQIASGSTWKQVSVGFAHSVGIKTDGTLWAWGYNSSGQIGDGTTTTRFIPVQISSSTNWMNVAAGTGHTVAIKTDGTLWSWGSGSSGALGNGSTTSSTSPAQTGSSTNWQNIAVGNQVSIATKSDGTMWAWGSNINGQLGQSSADSATHSSPLQIGTSTNWSNAISVACGGYHVSVVKSNGTLWAWGYNGYGELGDGTATSHYSPEQIGTSTSWKSASAGQAHSLATRTDGTLWAWGRNLFGAVGDGSGVPRYLPVQIGTDSDWKMVSAGIDLSCATKANGTLLSWGEGTDGQLGCQPRRPLPPAVNLGPVLAAVAGPTHSLAVKADGTLWAWGHNGNGQLGDGSASSRFSPVQIGSSSNWKTIAAGGIYTGFGNTLALKTDGTLWAWGFNENGQLGDGTTITRYTPVQVGTFSNWIQVVCGNLFSIGLRTDGTLWAWGYNSSGQLGDGTTVDHSTPLQIGTNNQWISVAAGQNHSLAIRSDGTLWAWGSNFNGQLGDGTTTSHSTPIQMGTDTHWTRVTAGQSHSLALKSDGSMWAWGSNVYGQLGDGTTTQRTAPTKIGTAANWKSVAAGYSHSLALTNDGRLWAWGMNASGQAGNLTNFQVLNPTQIGESTAWTTLYNASMGNHNLATTSDGTLWGFGANEFGQLASAGRNQNHPNYIAPSFSDQGLTTPLPSQIFVGTPVNLAWTSTSGLPINYLILGPATLSGNQLAATSGGTITVLGYQPGDDFWQATNITVQNTQGQTTQSGAVPTVVSLVPTSVTGTSAVLNGTVNPNGTATTTKFQLGTTINFGTDLPVTLSMNNSSSEQGISIAINTLKPHTDYHCRVSATNTFGTANGQDSVFTTLDTAPSVATDLSNVVTAVNLPLVITGTYNDADGDDPTITSTVGVIAKNTSSKTWSLAFTPTVLGFFPVTVTANDGFGGITNAEFTITVTNKFPITFTNASQIGDIVNSPAIDGLNLQLSLGFAPAPNTELTILRNVGSFPILGTFMNLPEGGVITATYQGIEYTFYADYNGGSTGLDLILRTQDPLLDPTFAVGGILNLDYYTDNYYFNNGNFAVQNDGKVILAGAYYSGDPANNIYYFGLARYSVDGTLDSDFGGTGEIHTDFGTSSFANVVAVQGDGKIVIAGSASDGVNTGCCLVRYNGNGSLDPTFGINGVAFMQIDSSGIMLFGISIQGNGKIVVTGFTSANARVASRDFMLLRFNTDGSPDTTFNTTGGVFKAYSSDQDYGQAVVTQPDGKIIVSVTVRESYPYPGNYYDILVRYNVDGSLDRTYPAFAKYMRSIALQTDGKLVAVGTTVYSNISDPIVARYTTDGNLDATFNGGGTASTYPFGGYVYPFSVSIQNDGKILIGGYAGVGVCVLRFKSNGSLDASLNATGEIITNLTGTQLIANSIVPQANGKFVVLSQTENSPYNAVVMRYFGTGVPPTLPFRTDINADKIIDLSTNSQDISSPSNPFRFWLNDDHDVGNDFSADDVNDGLKDSDNAFVLYERDLEDFAILNLSVPASISAKLQSGTTIVFSVIGNGQVKIMPISKPGFDYLSDSSYGRTLVTPPTNGPLYSVSSSSTTTVPLDRFFSTPHSSDQTLGFIFEGVAATDAGAPLILQGNLIDQNGVVVGRTESFYLQLQPITQYYDHFTVGTTSTPGIALFQNPEMVLPSGFAPLSSPLTLTQNIGETSDPNSPYVLFVHGWRMEPWMRIKFAETAFKRLYWAGYRGGFGLYSWPTEYFTTPTVDNFTGQFSADDADNYDRSEFQAWQAAAGLRMVLSALETGNRPRVRLLAHSMGNICASEALRLGQYAHSPQIYSYIASQAASEANAYDPNLTPVFNLQTMPDMYIGYFSGIRSMVSNGIYNFCNPGDFALKTGVFSWPLVQHRKPDGWGVNFAPSYGYRFNLLLQQFERSASSLFGPWAPFDFGSHYEEFAFAAVPSCNALGAESAAMGEISNTVRLDAGPYSFTSEEQDHSAQFHSIIHLRNNYWLAVLGAGGMGSIPSDPSTTPSANFQQWAQQWLGVVGVTFDPLSSFVGDGVPNLTKYAFGLNPLQSGGLPHIAMSLGSATPLSLQTQLVGVSQSTSATITLSYWCKSNAPDLLFSVEQSSDLKNWLPVAATPSIELTSGQLQLVDWAITVNNSKLQFYRVRVSISN